MTIFGIESLFEWFPRYSSTICTCHKVLDMNINQMLSFVLQPQRGIFAIAHTPILEKKKVCEVSFEQIREY